MGGVPDTWFFAATAGAGNAANIAVPASGPGVCHVLTHIHARVVGGNGAASAAFGVNVSVIDGGSSLGSVWTLVIPAMAANAFQGDDYDSDVLYIGSPASILTLQWSAVNPVGVFGLVTINGYEL